MKQNKLLTVFSVDRLSPSHFLSGAIFKSKAKKPPIFNFLQNLWDYASTNFNQFMLQDLLSKVFLSPNVIGTQQLSFPRAAVLVFASV